MGGDDGDGVEAIDDRIRSFLDCPSAVAKHRLVETGELGLRRLLDLWYRITPDAAEILDFSRRERVDNCTEALGALIAVAPDTYIAAISNRRLGTVEVSLLGDCKVPAAIAILCDHVGDRADWLIRSNAVRALVRLDDPNARPCIEAALADEEPSVRHCAIEGIARWDPERAIGLYEELLAEPRNDFARSVAMEELERLRSWRSAGS